MSEWQNNGGSAFPVTPTDRGGQIGPTELGMTLRDYFAAKALQGFMANKANPMTFNPVDDAAWAYMLADAMLKARAMPLPEPPEVKS